MLDLREAAFEGFPKLRPQGLPEPTFFTVKERGWGEKRQVPLLGKVGVGWRGYEYLEDWGTGEDIDPPGFFSEEAGLLPFELRAVSTPSVPSSQPSRLHPGYNTPPFLKKWRLDFASPGTEGIKPDLIGYLKRCHGVSGTVISWYKTHTCSPKTQLTQLTAEQC